MNTDFYADKIQMIKDSPKVPKKEKEAAIDLTHSLFNPVYFINTHCKIETLSKGLQPFKLYEYQEKAIEQIFTDRFTFFLKSRQMGFTTQAAAYALWHTFRPGKNVLLLSRREDDSMDILRKVKIMYENLPANLKIPLKSSNATTMEFENKNQITSLPATERSGAGRSANLIFLDEFSAFPAAKDRVAGEDVWTSILPTISTDPDSKVVVMSTPKGMGNHFANLWHQENGFAKTFFSWTQHPKFKVGLRERTNQTDGYGKYTSDWAEPLIKNMTPSGWAQEFNGDFVQSGRPVFDWNSLIKTEIEPEDKKYSNHFTCGVDLASGSGDDWHVAQFVCIETGRQVEMYRSKEALDIFARTVADKCKRYNTAKLAFENNSGYGLTFMKFIKDYPNLYFQKRPVKRNEKRTDKLGWNTNKNTKELMISDMNIAFINKQLKLTDDVTINECKTYQYDEQDRMNAQAGFHDDTVISLGIAWQVAKEYSPDSPIRPTAIRGKSPTVINGGVPIDPRLFTNKRQRDWRIG